MSNVKVTLSRRGGDRLERLLREAGKGGVKSVRVGFFSTAKYEDGTPVAAVAAWNEFGTESYTIEPKNKKALAFTGSDGETVIAKSVQHPGIPERPFFRQAIARMEDGVVGIIKSGIDPRKLIVDKNLADELGAFAQGEIQQSIVNLGTPPNEDATIKSKGSSNPLVDTGFMRDSVTWVVEQ